MRHPHQLAFGGLEQTVQERHHAKNDRGFSVIAFLLFVAGLGVLALALYLLIPFSHANAFAAAFTVVDLIVLYLLLFGPALIGDRISALTGGRIVSLGVYWYAAGVYALLTIGIVVCVNVMPRVPIEPFIVLQLVALLGVLFAAYMGDVAHGHTIAVERDEKAALSNIESLRASSSQLTITIRHLDTSSIPAWDDLVQMTERIAEDLRYLTPSQDLSASILEDRIMSNLSSISANVSSRSATAQTAEASCNVARETIRLLEQRKTMRA